MFFVKLIFFLLVALVACACYCLYFKHDMHGYLVKDGLHQADGSNFSFMNYGYWNIGENISMNDASEQLCTRLFGKAGVALANAKHILDVGCGKGMQDIILANQTKASIIGIDICADNIDMCKNLAKKHSLENQITYKTGDACKLPFSDNSFDVVISLESAFHYSPRSAFFSEASRVLRPGGTLLIGDIIINEQSFFLRQFQNFICSYLSCTNINPRGFKNWENELKMNGFDFLIEDVTEKTFVPFYDNFLINFNNPNIFLHGIAIFWAHVLKYTQKKCSLFSYVLASCTTLPSHARIPKKKLKIESACLPITPDAKTNLDTDQNTETIETF